VHIVLFYSLRSLRKAILQIFFSLESKERGTWN
jgi:hypothetical protein